MYASAFYILLASVQGWNPTHETTLWKGPCKSLVEDLQNIPGIDLNKFKTSTFNLIGDNGYVIDQGLQEYINKGVETNGDSFIMKVKFTKAVSPEPVIMKYFIHVDNVDANMLASIDPRLQSYYTKKPY